MLMALGLSDNFNKRCTQVDLTTDKKIPSGECGAGYGDNVIILRDFRSGFGFIGNVGDRQIAFIWPTQEHVGELGYEHRFPASEVLQVIKFHK